MDYVRVPENILESVLPHVDVPRIDRVPPNRILQVLDREPFRQARLNSLLASFVHYSAFGVSLEVEIDHRLHVVFLFGKTQVCLLYLLYLLYLLLIICVGGVLEVCCSMCWPVCRLALPYCRKLLQRRWLRGR